MYSVIQYTVQVVCHKVHCRGSLSYSTLYSVQGVGNTVPVCPGVSDLNHFNKKKIKMAT